MQQTHRGNNAEFKATSFKLFTMPLSSHVAVFITLNVIEYNEHNTELITATDRNTFSKTSLILGILEFDGNMMMIRRCGAVRFITEYKSLNTYIMLFFDNQNCIDTDLI